MVIRNKRSFTLVTSDIYAKAHAKIATSGEKKNDKVTVIEESTDDQPAPVNPHGIVAV